MLGRSEILNAQSVAARMDETQLEEYNTDYRDPTFSGIKENLLRYYNASQRRRLAAKKWSKIPYQSFEEKFPKVFQEWFRMRQIQAKSQFFHKLDRTGIPNDPLMIESLELEENKKSTLGNRIWLYESRILHSFTPVNTSHRYRGMPRYCNATKGIYLMDIQRDEEEAIILQAKTKKAQEKNPFLFLHKAAVSKRHYRFLKALAKAQLVTVPMTILQTVMEDVFPAFEDIYNYYCVFMKQTNRKAVEVVNMRGKVSEKLSTYGRI